MKNGVPFDQVFECERLAAHERVAMSIVFSEIEGNEWDWSAMKFKEQTHANG
ncbi:MAG: hypothetical protein JO171_17760 [Paludibacterium sp.]|uniref:hypothetical protein n=1 Tax=Paludibacterium sp. TaxID=1917523 RepID=UPI0025E674F8|nr:hypothetical protein [Paludibacterium sp.]MBV8049000.1 hypothetical protein [Paludibacterium sp.]MBV8647483.1 hypothetical protein [Paludibacterium sp.]